MALVLADRVKETSTTTGTGTVTLSGTAPAGFQTFGTSIGNGNTTYYTIAGQGTAEWEVGIGTYSSTGPTLSRDTVLSSSAGGTTKVSFSAGIKDVFVTYPANKSIYQDASGNVGIGTSSPGAKLDVSGAVRSTGNFLGSTGTSGFVSLSTETNVANGGSIVGRSATSSYNTAGVEFYAGGSERMRITSAGNVGIGTSAPTEARLHVNGNIRAGLVTSDPVNSNANIYTLNNVGGTLSSLLWRFVTNANDVSAGTERMRITSGGQVLVNNTTNDSGTGGQFFVKATDGNACVSAYNTAQNTFCYAARVNNTNAYFGWFNYNTTTVGSIGTNGTSTSYNTTSDARLKENIQDAVDAGALIDAIKVRQFDWRLTGDHQRYGAIAQELLEVFPEAVHVPADPEQMMGVDFSTFVPALIKEVQALRARVAALEAK